MSWLCWKTKWNWWILCFKHFELVCKMPPPTAKQFLVQLKNLRRFNGSGLCLGLNFASVYREGDEQLMHLIERSHFNSP